MAEKAEDAKKTRVVQSTLILIENLTISSEFYDCHRPIAFDAARENLSATSWHGFFSGLDGGALRTNLPMRHGETVKHYFDSDSPSIGKKV